MTKITGSPWPDADLDPVDVDGTLIAGNTLFFESLQWAAWVYDTSASSPRVKDLGSLGGGLREGGSTYMSDVDGTVVVGSSSTVNGSDVHAFAYDTAAAAPVMRDLGTLRPRTGTWGHSEASAIDDSLVVGTSTLPGGEKSGPFVYDLDGSARMVDISGGREGEATAVDAGVVVGSLAFGLSSASHAFAYDAGAPQKPAVDLGTLGNDPSSVATAVRDHVVVGYSQAANGSQRAFSYDLRSDTRMRDLGPITGPEAAVEDIDDNPQTGAGLTIVGTSARSAFTVAPNQPPLRPLPGLGGTAQDDVDYPEPDTEVADLDAGLLVGRSARAVDDKYRAYVLDLEANSILDLPTPSRLDRSEAVAVSRDPRNPQRIGVVAGDVNGEAAFWTLTPYTKPDPATQPALPSVTQPGAAYRVTRTGRARFTATGNAGNLTYSWRTRTRFGGSNAVASRTRSFGPNRGLSVWVDHGQTVCTQVQARREAVGTEPGIYVSTRFTRWRCAAAPYDDRSLTGRSGTLRRLSATGSAAYDETVTAIRNRRTVTGPAVSSGANRVSITTGGGPRSGSYRVTIGGRYAATVYPNRRHHYGLFTATFNPGTRHGRLRINRTSPRQPVLVDSILISRTTP